MDCFQLIGNVLCKLADFHKTDIRTASKDNVKDHGSLDTIQMSSSLNIGNLFIQSNKNRSAGKNPECG